jgi:hypothetical protein
VTAPYRMFSLIENCPSSQHRDVKTVRGVSGEVTTYISRWLDANPGRWFIVGEMTDRSNFLGVESRGLRKLGYESETVNNKIYGRLPHASGVPLSACVTRAKPTGYKTPLPSLESDPFDWSISELRTAASTAREWLLGAEGYAQAA